MATLPPPDSDSFLKRVKRSLAEKWYFYAGAVVALILVATFARQVPAFIDRVANTASVAGLIVSIIGFALTVWTVYQTQRANREAQRQIEREVNAARQETRQAVEKIALQLLQSECEEIYRLLMEARRTIREGQWPRAAEKCQEAKQSIVRLGAYRHLDGQEKDSFAAGAGGLQETIGFIERNRMKPSPPVGLPPDKLQPLETLLTQVERTRARLLQLFLEVPYANQP